MKKIILSAIDAAVMSSNAFAATTITFDDLPTIPYNPAEPEAFIPQGYGGIRWGFMGTGTANFVENGAGPTTTGLNNGLPGAAVNPYNGFMYIDPVMSAADPSVGITGYNYGLVSGKYDAFNAGANPAAIASMSGTVFSLNSLVLSMAVVDNNPITITGMDSAGNVLHTYTTILDANPVIAPNPHNLTGGVGNVQDNITLNWTGLSFVNFSTTPTMAFAGSCGSVANPYAGFDPGYGCKALTTAPGAYHDPNIAPTLSLVRPQFVLDNLNVTVSSVPVPSAVWLFSSTLAGFGFFGRRNTA
jgi:hypothetical protein